MFCLGRGARCPESVWGAPPNRCRVCPKTSGQVSRGAAFVEELREVSGRSTLKDRPEQRPVIKLANIFGVCEAQAGVGACNGGYELMRLLSTHYRQGQTRCISRMWCCNSRLSARQLGGSASADRHRALTSASSCYGLFRTTLRFAIWK